MHTHTLSYYTTTKESAKHPTAHRKNLSFFCSTCNTGNGGPGSTWRRRVPWVPPPRAALHNTSKIYINIYIYKYRSLLQNIVSFIGLFCNVMIFLTKFSLQHIYSNIQQDGVFLMSLLSRAALHNTSKSRCYDLPYKNFFFKKVNTYIVIYSKTACSLCLCFCEQRCTIPWKVKVMHRG